MKKKTKKIAILYFNNMCGDFLAEEGQLIAGLALFSMKCIKKLIVLRYWQLLYL